MEAEMTRLFVANLPYSLSEDELSAHFSQYGPLRTCTIVTDRYSGQSRGFAFLEFQSALDAAEALRALDESSLGGRRIIVREAKPRRDENG
jgi:RNA recognition motif-containing protein